jgi:hypothetical protein
MRRLAATVLILATATGMMAADWQPPRVAMSLTEFEAAYPKRTVSAGVLEIERLSARLGIDSAPKGRAVADPDDEDRVLRIEIPDDGRERPDPELAKRNQSVLSATSKWVHEQLSEPSDRVGAPPEAVSKYLEENATTIDSIVAVATKPGPLEWDLDVKAGLEAPIPNYLGLLYVDRVLAARALMQVRARESQEALQAAEAMWRIGESFASRPELIAHLIVAAKLKLIVGLLRKIDDPAFGWESRLRERGFFRAFLVAIQNDPWPAASDPEMQPSIEVMTRIYRRFADSLVEVEACEWTTDSLQHSFDVAKSGENGPEQVLMEIATPNFVSMVLRWRKVLLDSELTALVLQARGEKAASREGAWPPKLLDLESEVCPRSFYTYKRNGGVVIAFEGKAPGEEQGSLKLPMTFRGAPPPTPTPTTTPTPAVTPTPTRIPR